MLECCCLSRTIADFSGLNVCVCGGGQRSTYHAVSAASTAPGGPGLSCWSAAACVELLLWLV
jgi:hypothetical protein